MKLPASSMVQIYWTQKTKIVVNLNLTDFLSSDGPWWTYRHTLQDVSPVNIFPVEHLMVFNIETP